jgi:hypothetical protein
METASSFPSKWVLIFGGAAVALAAGGIAFLLSRQRPNKHIQVPAPGLSLHQCYIAVFMPFIAATGSREVYAHALFGGGRLSLRPTDD